MEMKQALHSFDWRAHEVEVVELKPCCIHSGRPVCILQIRITPLLSPAFEFCHPFYRSSGKNSGLPDVWLPFRGIDSYARWFNKHFRLPLEENPVWNPCRSKKTNGRWGHQIYRAISDWLGKDDSLVEKWPIEDNMVKAGQLCPVLDWDSPLD